MDPSRPQPRPGRIRRVVTDRRGGRSAAPYDSFNLATHVGDDASAVQANRARLAGEIGVAPAALVWMEQVHGRGVSVVSSPSDQALEMTDALVTSTPGLVLCVLVADCVPVLLWDDVHGVIGAVHAGRQGLRLGVTTAAVAAMGQLGAEPATTSALLGPAIGPADYGVPASMRDDVELHAPGSAAQTASGAPALDLRAGLLGQLRSCGVESVSVDPRSTATEPTLFSYRRDGGVTGRQAGLVWIAT